MIADPHAQPLSAKAWRKQAEAGKLRWQKVPCACSEENRGGRCCPGPRNDHPGVAASGPERWLLIERHRDGPYTYYLSNAPRQHLSQTDAQLGPSPVED